MSHPSSRIYGLLLALAFVSPLLASAVENGPGRFEAAGLDDAEVRQFLQSFQDAVKSRRADRVVGLVEFPLQVNLCKGSQTLQRKDFTRRFPSVFDARISEAIRKQTFEDLFTNSQGVMIGDGEVWFSGICEGTAADDDPCSKHRIRVITVNKGCP
ncbi:MAG: hypothetical protein ACJ75H_08700 [Thermoanaerobaculia bacterium]